MIRVCENPSCAHDLAGLKRSARYCSAACRTAAYRTRAVIVGDEPRGSVFDALRGRVTSHRPVTGPMRDRHRASA